MLTERLCFCEQRHTHALWRRACISQALLAFVQLAFHLQAATQLSNHDF